MKVEREPAPAGPMIRGFVGRGFSVEGAVYDSGLLITPEWARGWDAPALEAIDVTAIEDVLAIAPAPEFLLLGTGATLRRPSPVFVAALDARGIGVEAMDSRAAARAWAVLRGEDRWIAGALLPLG